MSKVNPKGDIYYYLPNRKSPIAYSTIYTAKLLIILSEIFGSINSVFKAIYRSQEAKYVLEKYIDKGYGKEIASKFFSNQLFHKSHVPIMYVNDEEYEVLLANSPWLYIIDQIKDRIEFHYENGNRIWTLKNDLLGLIGVDG